MENSKPTVLFTYTIYGDPPSKKNGKIYTRLKNGRTILVSNKKCQRWEKEARAQFKNDKIKKYKIEEPVNVKFIIYRKNRIGGPGDLVNFEQAALDILVETGVLKDDNNDIVKAHDGSRMYYDKENPRVEVEISLCEV